MVSEKLKHIFFFVVILSILHAIEEYFTGFYNFDRLLFVPLGQILPISSQMAFVVFQIIWVFLLIWSYRLNAGRKSLFIVSIFWGIALVLELEHLYRAFSFGAAILFGSISGLILSILIFIGWDLLVRLREEKQLEQHFGEEYLKYKKATRRWL